MLHLNLTVTLWVCLITTRSGISVSSGRIGIIMYRINVQNFLVHVLLGELHGLLHGPAHVLRRRKNTKTTSLPTALTRRQYRSKCPKVKDQCHHTCAALQCDSPGTGGGCAMLLQQLETETKPTLLSTVATSCSYSTAQLVSQSNSRADTRNTSKPSANGNSERQDNRSANRLTNFAEGEWKVEIEMLKF